MVTIVPPSVSAGLGAASMLRSSSGSSAGGLFDSLSGTKQRNSATALFNALGGGNSQTSIDSILHKQKVTNARNAMYYNAAERITYIQEGKLDPTEDWEKIVGYAMNKGLPSIAFIDDEGKMQAQLQSEADLSKYNSGQVRALLESMVDIDEMAQKIQANETKQGWLDSLSGANTNLYYVANYILPPQESTPNNWEQEGVNLINNDKPFRITLDVEGKLQVTDQLFDPTLNDLPDTLRTTLMAAISSIPETIRNGTALEQWELDAMHFAESKVGYYLEIDPISGVISAKENSGENITPDFLKTPPYPEIGAKTPLLERVAELIAEKKPYFLDIDATGAVVAKETNAQNLIKYNTPSERKLDALGVGTVLSLFA